MGHQQISQTQQHLFALGGRELRPGARLKHLPCIAHRRVDIFLATSSDIRQALPGRRIDRSKGLPRLRGAMLAVDHGLIGKFQRNGTALPLCKLEHDGCS